MNVDTLLLKKLSTSYDASKVYKQGKKIYFFFREKGSDRFKYPYYLFNSEFNFNKNFELLKYKFANLQGTWNLFTDNTLYPVTQKQSSHLQLELF